MFELPPSTKTAAPVTARLPPWSCSLPPPVTWTEPAVDVAVLIANKPVTLRFWVSAKALPVFRAPETLRLLPASVLPMAAVAAQSAVKLGLPLTFMSPKSDLSRPLTTTLRASTSNAPALRRSTVPMFALVLSRLTVPAVLVASSVMLPLEFKII